MPSMLIALIAPLLWAASNHIDKHMLESELEDCEPGALLLFSSLIGLIAAPVIFVFQPAVLHIARDHALLVVANGIIYVVGLLPYFYALKEDDAASVVPLFQTTVIFSYILGWLVLGEVPSLLEMGASVLILAGSIALSIDFGATGGARLKLKPLLLMLAASFLNALNFLLFKLVAVGEDFWVTSFWEYIGFALFGIAMFVLIGRYRRQFLGVLGNHRRVVGWSMLNETLGIGAKTATNFASLSIPIGMVSTINGLQPFFVLLIGMLLTVVLRQLRGGVHNRGEFIKKTSAIGLMFAGTFLIAGQ